MLVIFLSYKDMEDVTGRGARISASLTNCKPQMQCYLAEPIVNCNAIYVKN